MVMIAFYIAQTLLHIPAQLSQQLPVYISELPEGEIRSPEKYPSNKHHNLIMISFF